MLIQPKIFTIGLVSAVLWGSVGCSGNAEISQSGNNPAVKAATPQVSQSQTAQSQIAQSQTAQSQTAQQQYKLTTLLNNLEHPWSMAWLPDGRMLITERPGRLQLLKPGDKQGVEITGIPPVLAQGQGGLMDVSVHPQFEKNRWIYLTYAHGDRESNRTRLARAKLEGQSLQNLQVIFEVSQAKSGTQHFGSRMAWMPDGTMLLAIGDGGNPPVSLEGALIRQQAQNRRSHLGKVLRLKDDGTIPADNPFVKDTAATPALWSYGHRNIQGLTIDAKTQQIWTSEHGAKGGDEVNLMQPGKNYGWPLVTHGIDYSGDVISQDKARPGLVDPKVIWTPSIAPSGLIVYRGDRFPAWNGNLFGGGLVSRDVRRIEVDTVGNEVAQESIPVGDRVRDVRQGPDGLIYILTDESRGKLLRLEPK